MRTNKKIILFVLLFTLYSSLSGQEKISREKIVIKNVLQIFQDGYNKRDTTITEEWFKSIFYDNAEIIGTFSIEPNTREWETGADESVKLFKSDWVGWGNLEMDLSKANIGIADNLAWVSFPAVITRSPENSRSRTAKESFSNMLKNFENIISDDTNKESERLKLLQIAYYSNLLLYQYERGEEFIWPMRISAVLQKEKGQWKIRQLHFSYPNRGFPNVRY